MSKARSLHGAPPSAPFALEIGSSEHYLDAALYDFEYRRRRADVNFYRGLARQYLRRGEPALELGCGSGRLTIPLARDGHLVLGLDLSAPMLERAQARAASLGRAARSRVAFARPDFRNFAVAPRFRLVAWLKSGALDYAVKSPESMLDMPHLARKALDQWNSRADRIHIQAQFRLLAENASDMITRLSLNGKIYYVSPAW